VIDEIPKAWRLCLQLKLAAWLLSVRQIGSRRDEKYEGDGVRV
jgi:hypothetical protein